MSRRLEIYRMKSKSDLQGKLDETMHSISRPPALMVSRHQRQAHQLNSGKYEVLECEPLLDI